MSYLSSFPRRPGGAFYHKSNETGQRALSISLKSNRFVSSSSQSIDVFSATVESLLRTHGNGIAERQFQLARVADCAIFIYSMATVLSRASRAVKLNLPSAEQELLMAQIWCKEASDRVQQNIHRIQSKSFKENYQRMATVASCISNQRGPTYTNPLEID